MPLAGTEADRMIPIGFTLRSSDHLATLHGEETIIWTFLVIPHSIFIHSLFAFSYSFTVFKQFGVIDQTEYFRLCNQASDCWQTHRSLYAHVHIEVIILIKIPHGLHCKSKGMLKTDTLKTVVGFWKKELFSLILIIPSAMSVLVHPSPVTSSKTPGNHGNSCASQPEKTDDWIIVNHSVCLGPRLCWDFFVKVGDNSSLCISLFLLLVISLII